MKKVFNYRALPMFFLFVVIGILVATFLDAWVIIPIIVLAALALFATLFISKIRKYLLRVIMVICALTLSLLSANIDVYFQRDYKIVNEEVAIVTGIVDNLSEFDENGVVGYGDTLVIRGVSYTADDGHEGKLSGKLKIFGDVGSDLKVGDRVTLTGKIFTIEFQPTSQEYLKNYRNGLRTAMNINTLDKVEGGKLGLFDSIKIGTKANLTKWSSSSKIGSFIYSMLYGDKSGMDSEIKDSFAISGLSHLFAVSGLHVGMIAVVIMAILRKVKVGKWLKLLILTIVLGTFNFLCCFSPSVMRATLMILVAQVSLALGFRNDSISTLSFAGVLMLLLRPMYLFDISFLMTFFAVLGIVLLNKPIHNKLTFMPTALSKPLSLGISVNLGIFPIVIYYFGSVSLLFMLANLIVIPIVTIAYPLIFIGNSITLILPFMGFIIRPISYLFELVALIGIGISKVPFFKVDIAMTVTFIVVWLVLLIFLSDYFVLGQKVKKITATVMVFLFTFMAFSSVIGVASDETSISAAYSDYYSDDAYYVLRHDGEEYLFINGELDIKAVSSVKYHMNSKGISDIEVLIKPDIDGEDLDFIAANMKGLGLKSLVMYHVDESFKNVWDIDMRTDLTANHLYIYCPTPYSAGLSVSKVNAIFSKDSQFEHTDVVYDIVYSNKNVMQVINYAPKYVVSNNIQAISPTPPNLINNDFTFKLKNGKIKVRSDNRWK